MAFLDFPFCLFVHRMKNAFFVSSLSQSLSLEHILKRCDHLPIKFSFVGFSGYISLASTGAHGIWNKNIKI